MPRKEIVRCDGPACIVEVDAVALDQDLPAYAAWLTLTIRNNDPAKVRKVRDGVNWTVYRKDDYLQFHDVACLLERVTLLYAERAEATAADRQAERDAVGEGEYLSAYEIKRQGRSAPQFPPPWFSGAGFAFD